MKIKSLVAVTSRSFSKHPILRSELMSRYEDVRFNDEGKSLKGDELVKFLEGSEKAIIALETIDDELLKNLPRLKRLSKMGVGLDNVDKDALQKRQINISVTPGTNKRSVSELTLALMLICLRNLKLSHHQLGLGEWRQTKGSCLTEKTVGIIGCGNVGRDLIHLLRPFDCKILGYDTLSDHEFYRKSSVVPSDLETLLRQSDVVTLHLPLNDDSRNILNAQRLSWMKQGAVLINTARGELVDEDALKSLLMEKRINAAAFDVFTSEPPRDRELIDLPNFFGTPHVGGSTEEAILAMGRAAIKGLEV